MIIGVIFAIVVVGVGITFLPAVKTVTSAIFESLGGTESMPALLALMVNAWPIIVLSFFVFGAYLLTRRGAK